LTERSTNRIAFYRAICTVFLVTFAISLLLPQPMSAALQDDAAVDVPSPAECTIEPRSVPSPPAMSKPVSSPSPSPTVPSGQPADDETIKAITAVVRGSIACTNAGDILRSLAYFTDEFVAQMFIGPNGVDYEGFLQYLSTPPAALLEDQQLAIVAISDVQELVDGTVSARVVTGNSDDHFEDILIFVEHDGEWLIAASIPITSGEATPTP
jgi:hypothetical protein